MPDMKGITVRIDAALHAEIHDIYPDEEDCSHVIRLDGVEAYELDQLYVHYEGHMEAERQMGMGL